jgi:hypothetical protein
MGFFESPNDTEFATLLAHEIDCARYEVSSKATLARIVENPPRLLPDSAYNANIQASLSRVLAPGKVLRLAVHVENTSDSNWLPTQFSGISLANRWRKKRSGRVKVWRDARAELTQVLAPGESVTLTLDVKVPARARQWILEIDLVDEGICWFQERGSIPARLATRVMHGAQYWQLLADKLGRTNRYAQ